jgi:hypothetical protein
MSADDAVMTAVGRVLASVRSELLAEVEARIAAIPKPRGIHYRGVWQAEADYDTGDTCTFRGALWHCNEATREVPGGTDLWTLVLKGPDTRGGKR